MYSLQIKPPQSITICFKIILHLYSLACTKFACQFNWYIVRFVRKLLSKLFLIVYHG